VTDPHNWSPTSVWQKVADTGAAGFALQNATPTILTWNIPNDGGSHVMLFAMTLHISSAETGGALGLNYTDPGGNANSTVPAAGGAGIGNARQNNAVPVQAGTTVTLTQTSALTAGAAVVWAQIWGT